MEFTLWVGDRGKKQHSRESMGGMPRGGKCHEEIGRREKHKEVLMPVWGRHRRVVRSSDSGGGGEQGDGDDGGGGGGAPSQVVAMRLVAAVLVAVAPESPEVHQTPSFLHFHPQKQPFLIHVG